MMTSKNKIIENHPAILLHSDLKQICQPLEKLNITYFGHARICQNEFAGISTNPQFYSHYLNNKFYNADLHMAKEGIVKDYFIWDHIEQTGESWEMAKTAIALGVNHTFTILQKSSHGEDYYHFGTHIDDKSINLTYLSNIDLLNLFIIHFNNSIAQSKALSESYNIKFNLTSDAGGFSINQNPMYESQSTLRAELLNDLSSHHYITLKNGEKISKRQIEILYWLHQGKTINDIAKILAIADVTINKHIVDIKSKTQSYTQFQLGEIFIKLFNSYPEIIEAIIK